MITLPDGNRFRTVPSDPLTLEGFTPDPEKPNLLVQDFLPCKYRKFKQCAYCPQTKQKKSRPSCTLKKITTRLTCVGCLERKP